MTTLEDLYYGNISPHERYIKRGTRVDKLVKLICKNEDELTAGLTEKQKEIFEKFQVLKNRKTTAVSEWIFPSLLDPSTHVKPSSAYHRLKEILEENNLPSLRFHDLRHTFATHALKNGVDPKTLSGILGHTNASFTLDTYTHLTVDMKRNAADVVTGFMANIVGEEFGL